MKVVVALDSLKGSVDAENACAAVARGLTGDVICKPMADGGEGTARAMLSARGGEWIPESVMGPLPDMDVEAGYAWFPETGDVLVEMAAASGLPLLKPEEYDPLRTTTYGTGELIRASLEHQPRRILLAVGGSATVDGGAGAAMALGWRFLDADEAPIELGGGSLISCATLVPPDTMNLPGVEVLCDVQNPLLGPAGAAPTFAPQKGATPSMVKDLEQGLAHLAGVVRTTLEVDMDIAGGGAAGGLSAGAAAFMGADLVPGIQRVIEVSGLEEALDGADWVVTGEGCFDEQSLGGKVVSGVIEAARPRGVRVAVLAGSVKLDEDAWRAAGVEYAAGLCDGETPLDYAMEHGVELLEQRAAMFMKAQG